MSGKAHRARRDQSEPEIIKALEQCGYQVRKIAQRGLPDLVAWRRNQQPVFIEAKTGKGKLRATQNWAELGLDVVVFRNQEDVAQWVNR